jgi:outer membrane protein OmpA-like peptidoglycan-associated protein
MTLKRWSVCVLGGGVLTLTRALSAQELDPPPPAAAEAEDPPPPAPAADAPPRASTLAEPPDWDDESAAEDGLAEESGEGEEAFEVYPEEDGGPVEEGEAADAARSRSLAESSGLMGATGLMRVLSASSGAPGTFRFSILTGFYSGSGFLCPQCPDNGQGADVRDEVDRVSANLFLSATPLPFLEAYAAVFSHSTSTDRPVQQLKQVVGDWNLGVKVFMPEADRIFSLGGAADIGFSTGSGQVGLSGIDSVNLGLHALASADLSKRSAGALPLRAHVNLSYLFDNSSNLVEDYERAQGAPIDRIERFSLDINRVDTLQLAFGAEGLFDTARPFLEWSIDIPANRQGYLCLRSETLSGDSCLRDRAAFSTTPSRLSAGIRAMPWSAVAWWPEGMTVTGALDLATGGASDFLVEVAPELPWSVWFGLSYAVDTRPRVKIEHVAVPTEVSAPELSVEGMVIEKETHAAIADALIRFEGRDLTGLISTAQGRFVTGSLEPGRYTFRINATGYKEGTCSVELGGAAPEGASQELLPTSVVPADARGLAAEAGAVEAPPGVSRLTCELEPVPKVSNLNGRVTDANSGNPIGVARVHITDVLGRELELAVDEVGAFRFENVPPGAAVITIQADGYLKSVTRIGVEPLQELDQRFSLAPVPQKSTVQVVGKQLSLATPIVFGENSAQLSREALMTLQELAPFLEQRPELGRVEIQSHTADASPPSAGLSTERANAIRDALVLHGVPSARLTARGYGGSDPLAPADSEENRRKNERIVFLLEGSTP